MGAKNQGTPAAFSSLDGFIIEFMQFRESEGWLWKKEKTLDEIIKENLGDIEFSASLKGKEIKIKLFVKPEVYLLKDDVETIYFIKIEKSNKVREEKDIALFSELLSGEREPEFKLNKNELNEIISELKESSIFEEFQKKFVEIIKLGMSYYEFSGKKREKILSEIEEIFK